MDYEIVWNAYYAILSKYAATNGLDYHKYLDFKTNGNRQKLGGNL